MMNNIKGLSITTDGNYKRLAITYDKVNESGKVVNGNNKINRLITDSDLLEAISAIEKYAISIVEIE